MKLKQAIDLIGGQSETARKLNVSQGSVWRWYNGKADMPAKYAPEIEHLTFGKITRQDICPDVRW